MQPAVPLPFSLSKHLLCLSLCVLRILSQEEQPLLLETLEWRPEKEAISVRSNSNLNLTLAHYRPLEIRAEISYLYSHMYHSLFLILNLKFPTILENHSISSLKLFLIFPRIKFKIIFSHVHNAKYYVLKYY